MRFEENHIPREQWDAFQRRRQERWDRGQATDEDTVTSDDDEEEEGEEEGEDNKVEADGKRPAPKVPLELQARDSAIAMFRRTLLFSQGAAAALYSDQAVQNLDTKTT
jgi:hypothetical protein